MKRIELPVGIKLGSVLKDRLTRFHLIHTIHPKIIPVVGGLESLV